MNCKFVPPSPLRLRIAKDEIGAVNLQLPVRIVVATGINSETIASYRQHLAAASPPIAVQVANCGPHRLHLLRPASRVRIALRRLAAELPHPALRSPRIRSSGRPLAQARAGPGPASAERGGEALRHAGAPAIHPHGVHHQLHGFHEWVLPVGRAVWRGAKLLGVSCIAGQTCQSGE